MENAAFEIRMALAQARALSRMVGGAEKSEDVEALPSIVPEYLATLEATLRNALGHLEE